jgi:hypothetical protein
VKLEELSREELVEIVKKQCCYCKESWPLDRDEKAFNEGEYYFVDQDQDCVMVGTDEGGTVFMFYGEATRHFSRHE